MRILFFSNVYPNPVSPSKGTFNGVLVRALAKDHLVHVVCPISWTDKLFQRRAGFSRQPILVEPSVTASYPTFWYPPKIMRTRYDRFLEKSVMSRVERDLIDFPPDAVLSYWAHPDAAVAVRIARQYQVPAVTMVGGSDVLLLARKGPRRDVILKTLHDSDAIIAVSADIADKLKQDGITNRKLFVIRRGVEGATFHPGDQAAACQKLKLPDRRNMVLGVGRLVPVKDWATLIEACALIKQRNIDIQCYILGDGPLKEPLRKLILKLGLQDQVHLQGAKSQTELADWYRASDLVVLPSVSEGVPNVLLEAMACGKPFVASNVGGIPEIADPLAHSLVSPGEPTGFATAIMERLKTRSVLPSRRFQPMSSDSSARRVIDIIEKCRRAHPGTALSDSRISLDSDSAMMILNVASAMQRKRS